MQSSFVAIARVADVPDDLALLDNVIHANGDARRTGVSRYKLIRMLDEQHIALPPHLVANIDDLAVGRRADRRPKRSENIDAHSVGWVRGELADHLAENRPIEHWLGNGGRARQDSSENEQQLKYSQATFAPRTFSRAPSLTLRRRLTDQAVTNFWR